MTSKRFILLALFLFVSGLAYQTAQAQENVANPSGSPIHPKFELLDGAGANVLETGQPVSTMQTCGTCHDTDFIEQHSAHADLGLAEDDFGRFDAINYRTVSNIDLTTVDWLRTLGARHVGGGPATTSRSGLPLTELVPDATNLESSITDPATGERSAWNWRDSGVVEMNCFMCHLPEVDIDARNDMLTSGQFGWANSVMLASVDLISKPNDRWQWNAAAFSDDGTVALPLQDPSNANCGSCHGVTHSDNRTPLTIADYQLGDAASLLTGQVMSPQKIAQSGLNISGKNELARSWDVHTERVLSCTDCHYSLNNPVYYQESAENRPEHLQFDPRRIDIGEYLYRPLHEIASADSQRSCNNCHDSTATHNWLPYPERHMEAVACQTCHIPELYAPSLQSIDWTVLTTDGEPHKAFRGIASDALDSSSLITPYQPTLLLRNEQLAPFNLVSAWYWTAGAESQPVPLAQLQAAWLDGATYHADVLATFDGNNDGQLAVDELVIDSAEKQTTIAQRLTAQGLEQPTIAGEVLPFAINHNVAQGNWVSKDCRACHSGESRLASAVDLAGRTPGGIVPMLNDGTVEWAGELVVGDGSELRFVPNSAEAGLYVFGLSANNVVDWFGVILFLSVWVGVFAHGGLRYLANRNANTHHTPMREVYMYDFYERFWHWLQTAAIFILLVTGFIIHKPDKFGVFSFSYMVQIHNVLAAILVLNATLSLFYHLVSGEIRQFLPQPRGFFSQAIEQTQYYLSGIFLGVEHPFDKTRDRKLNPLQQVTYFGILNVLLPLQIITGALMWGAQRWPAGASRFGGLPLLAPFHTLVAWSFASFIVMHVYLTTTGHTPIANIKAMMLGWDEIEIEPAGD